MLALGTPDAVAGELPAVSAASAVQPPWCAAAAAELQASAAARRAEVVPATVAELAGPSD